MCGIVGAVAERPVNRILLASLQRLEYRGYDSAGIANILADGRLASKKTVGKVSVLANTLPDSLAQASVGIAHTRWATHGRVTQANAHPHCSGDRIAIVHNGIIENHQTLRRQLQEDGYQFCSDTDSESIAHLLHQQLAHQPDLLSAMQSATKQLQGAYGAVAMDTQRPNELVAARAGSPLVIGIGLGEHFIASDPIALLPVTRLFIYLQEGDIAHIRSHQVTIYDASGREVTRPVVEANFRHDEADKGDYRHFMLKEIFEQPTAVRNTLASRLTDTGIYCADLSPAILAKTKHVQILACGTSYHSGLVAKYWLEQYANVSCHVEIASEYRYRKATVVEQALLVVISQSGETADTLAALRLGQQQHYLSTLAITNTASSSLAREAAMVMLTHAGTEVGVASTKAFTTQLTCLLALTAALTTDQSVQRQIYTQLTRLPASLEEALHLEQPISAMAHSLVNQQHTLFLGRGSLYPIAMEGALKLKEISYIHAEAYAAGELKHGPLALIDDKMPTVVLAPNNALLSKLLSNLAEVQARGGQLFVFAEHTCQLADNMAIIRMPAVDDLLAPMVYALALQLLAYHVAVLKGTNIDQPRNLAKSVTVE